LAGQGAQMSAPSAKPLFKAISGQAGAAADAGAPLFGVKPQAVEMGRDPLDYDPTPPDATAAFLAVEGARLREIGGPIWEPAVGAGHMARVFEAAGFEVIGSDVVDRGWPGVERRSFYDYDRPPGWARIIVTNPPYCEVNARDGHGRWLKHIEALGVEYAALLLNWDWLAARINGMDALHARFPVARAYLCCWKIDFRGLGAPPQRNGWLVWDRAAQGETVLRRLFREQGANLAQGVLI